MAMTNLEGGRFQTLSKWTLRRGSLGAFALGWEIIGRTLNSLLLLTFSEMVPALVGLLASKELWRAVWISNKAMALGFTLAAVQGGESRSPIYGQLDSTMRARPSATWRCWPRTPGQIGNC